ncbi:SRPBCC domain-containing protein [Tsukamurella sp. 1534]|uniref:SRPBCC domain-containing protein n=1 Tax=Tsukamurella sp. 1534 TaxID=1151061 RepID=UPI0002F4CAAD|nr:SRPBCC domain-containing protein [Tsukamurella sp. 1534]
MREDTATRTVTAAPAQVRRAFADADLLARWLPPSGMTGVLDRHDLRPGGGFRLRLVYDGPHGAPGKHGPDEDVSEVRIPELGDRAVWLVDFPSDDPAYAGTMTMTWTFLPVDGGTEVTVRATGVPPGISPEDHAEGLASSLANLAAAVEDR